MATQKFTDKTVLEHSLERIRTAYDRFDRIIVSFSGGKDSTVVLNLALQVAKERGKLPLDVVYFDEEAVHPPTIDYIERVRALPEIRFHWYCVPFEHRNACSRKQAYWYCWNPEEKEKWCRPMPEGAITEVEGFEIGMGPREVCDILFPEYQGTMCVMLGIRTQESVRRYRMVTARKDDNWYNLKSKNNKTQAFPIYDWKTDDVWYAPSILDWDYNHTYDVFDKCGVPWSSQRVTPPFGEEPLRGLWLYSECFPELFDKMLNRVHGVATAWRYGNTELYSIAIKSPPEGKTWESYMYDVIKLYPPEDQGLLVKNINSLIDAHNKKSKAPLDENIPDPISGVSWKLLCKIALKGDFKGRLKGKAMYFAEEGQRKLGITLDQAMEHYAIDDTHKRIYNLKNKIQE